MFYIQIDSGNIIHDCIEYEHPGYIPADSLLEPLPQGITTGWYRWDGTDAVLDPDLKAADINEMIKKASAEAADAAVLDMLERGAL